MRIYTAIQSRINQLQKMQANTNTITRQYIAGKIAGLMSIIEIMEVMG